MRDEVSRKLINIREARGHTRTHAARIMQLPHSGVRNIEQRKQVSPKTVHQAAQYYGLTEGEIIRWIVGKEEV